MRKSSLIGWIALGALTAALGLSGYGADKATDDAKAYEATLKSMMGADFNKIIAKLHEWKFEALDTWQAENPTSKDISRRNRSKVKFSSQDYKDIFGGGGKFKVIIYNKLVGSDASHVGEIDDQGRGLLQDTKINLEIYTVIRAVFKDDVMIVLKVWPKIERSGFTGGTWIRR